MAYSIENFKNNIDFFLRQKIAISRKNYTEQNESKEGLFDSKNEINKEKYLFDKYNLELIKSSTTRKNYLENLYLLDILDKYLNIENTTYSKALDIGSKNWSYAKAEYFFFKKHSTELSLDGIELDSNRLYSNFYSANEVAKFHIKDLKQTNYISGDFLEYKQKYNYIIWLLPFILEYPLSKWGLPKKYFKPEEMLEHAYNSLKENGQIFIINQGKEEYETQKSLYEKTKIKFKDIGLINNDFSIYKKKRYLTIIQN